MMETMTSAAFASPPGGPAWLFGLALLLAVGAEVLRVRYGL
jgi:hypothetical protein